MRSSLAVNSEGATTVVHAAAVNVSASCIHIAAPNQSRQYRNGANRIASNPIVGMSQNAMVCVPTSTPTMPRFGVWSGFAYVSSSFTSCAKYRSRSRITCRVRRMNLTGRKREFVHYDFVDGDTVIIPNEDRWKLQTFAVTGSNNHGLIWLQPNTTERSRLNGA